MKRQAILLVVLLSTLAVAQQPGAADGSQWLHRNPGVAAGNVQGWMLSTKTYGRRRVWVYTPAGYDRGRKVPYDLVVCFDGSAYLESGDIPLPIILDNLGAAGKLPPMVALLIDNGSGAARVSELANSARFADLVGNEILPWLHSGWNVTSDPQRVIVTGFSAGGLGATYVAFQRSDLFGNVLAQSGAFWRGNEGRNDPPYEWLTEQFKKSPKLPLRLYLEVGARETAQAMGTGPPFIDANRRLRKVLNAKGYALFYKEVPRADHQPGHWKLEVANGLLWLVAGWPQQP